MEMLSIPAAPLVELSLYQEPVVSQNLADRIRKTLVLLLIGTALPLALISCSLLPNTSLHVIIINASGAQIDSGYFKTYRSDRAHFGAIADGARKEFGFDIGHTGENINFYIFSRGTYKSCGINMYLDKHLTVLVKNDGTVYAERDGGSHVNCTLQALSTVY
jgi:hypothetical protein